MGYPINYVLAKSETVYTRDIPGDRDSVRISGYPWDIPGMYCAAWAPTPSLLTPRKGIIEKQLTGCGLKLSNIIMNSADNMINMFFNFGGGRCLQWVLREVRV